ncbi:MAG: hypothetical protein JO159_03910 [Acidobacteria bacterium]|nr:hypothetical protein [Acidobacteriota bacterium]
MVGHWSGASRRQLGVHQEGHQSPRFRALHGPYQRVFGHPGFHVMDGSAMPANPGVNSSLIVTALAERANAQNVNLVEQRTRGRRAPLGVVLIRSDHIVHWCPRARAQRTTTRREKVGYCPGPPY